MTREALFPTLFPALDQAIERLRSEHVPLLRRLGAVAQADALENIVADLAVALRSDIDRDLPVAEAAEVVGMNKTSVHELVAKGEIPRANGRDDVCSVRVLDAAAYRLQPRSRASRRRRVAPEVQDRDRVITREVSTDE